jgi:hypothetical protein
MADAKKYEQEKVAEGQKEKNGQQTITQTRLKLSKMHQSIGSFLMCNSSIIRRLYALCDKVCQ